MSNAAAPALWVTAGAVARIPCGKPVPFAIGPRQLVLVRDGAHVHAVERACPHEQADLAGGRCTDGRIVCPHHMASFDLATGEASAGWCIRALRRHDVRIEQGQILVSAIATSPNTAP